MGQHWYDTTGKAHHTYINSKGEEKDTTLREARKHNWSPSVTSILNILASPGLEIWKQNNILMAALTLPKRADEDESDWIARVKLDAKEEGMAAANEGTLIHQSIDKHFGGKRYPDEHKAHVASAIAAIDRLGLTDAMWRSERSFCSRLGFAGCIDLSAPNIILDWKTKVGITADTKPYKLAFPNHIQQLAAYAVGLGFELNKTKAFNVFIDRDTGAYVIKEWTTDELAGGWAVFSRALEIWQITKRYIPTNEEY